LRRAGLAHAAPWPREGLSPDGGLGCDSLGCIYQANGQTVALVLHPSALGEDCARATVVISTIPVRGRRCRRAAVVIDRFDLWRRGAHALWLDSGGIRVRSVADASGRRPWTPHRARPLPRGRDRP